MCSRAKLGLHYKIEIITMSTFQRYQRELLCMMYNKHPVNGQYIWIVLLDEC